MKQDPNLPSEPQCVFLTLNKVSMLAETHIPSLDFSDIYSSTDSCTLVLYAFSSILVFRI